MASEVVLYQTPPSFYSQIARLVLAEKGVAHRLYLAAAGPPTFETYEPWYMRLNPGGTVPTLVADGVAVDDSRKILHFVDERFEGPRLTPEDPGQREVMEAWIARAYSLPERSLAYGSGSLRGIGRVINRGRRHTLERRRDAHPELREAYEAKIADIDRFIEETADPQGIERLRQRTTEALDELNRHLDGREFICGSYGLADVVWTVTVARQHMLGSPPLGGRPHLQRWYASVRARPSFRAAGIWERFHPEILLPQVAWKLRWRLLAAVALAVGAVAVLRVLAGAL